MKILIDMQPLQTPFSSKRGVGAYTAGIVRELHKIALGHELEYLFNGEFPDEYFRCLALFPDIVRRDNSHVFTQNILTNYRTANDREIAFAERFYTAFVESLEPDVLFSPNLQEGLDDRAVTTFAGGSRRFIQIATLHDLIPLHKPENYLADGPTNRWYRRKIADAVRCDRVVTVSNASKRDIEHFLDVSPSKIQVVANGYDPDIYNARASVDELHAVQEFVGSDEPYVLYVGGADHHKNLPRLIAAYAKLPRELKQKFSLVIGGRESRSASAVLHAISDHKVHDRVRLPGFVPGDLLPALIRQASLFVFPSTHEGFGLPALEAMACGTPTIGSAGTSVEDVIDFDEATFDPHKVSDISKTMARALVDEGWRGRLREHGLRRSADFSWGKSAAGLLEVIETEHAARLRGGSLSFISARLAELGPAGHSLMERAATSIAETVPLAREKRVYLDVSSVAEHGGNSGIQRVVRAIANHLDTVGKFDGAKVEIIYAAEGSTQFRKLTSVADYVPDEQADPPVEFGASDILLFLDLQPNLAIRMESRMQRLRALGVKVYYLVYDLLPVLMPEKFWPELQNEFYRWLQVVSRSDGLICISRTVAEEAADYLGQFGIRRPDPLQIDYFHLGSDIESTVLSDGLPTDHEEIEQRFGQDLKFLTVGTLEPRKGHEQTILAFEEAWRRGESWRLIIVGKQGWKMNRLALTIRDHPEFGRRLFWFEKASDEWLERLYELSDCVICASEGEGFGLPLIEAANHGKPVIARDIPVFREVAADGAFYFPASADPLVLARSIRDWADLHAAGRSPGSEAMEPLTWEAATRQLAAVLQKDKWRLQVQPGGAVDLRHTITNSSPNVRSSGFYVREPEFAWATSQATIEFQTTEAFKSVRIELHCFSWRRMPFKVLLDGEVIYSGTAETKAKEYEFEAHDVPPGAHKIELISETTGAPEGDDRVLGIALKDLTMQATVPIAFGEWINARDARVRWRGFSPVEFDWRWTLGERSVIEFEVPEEEGAAAITLFGHSPKPLEIRFLLNGELIHSICGDEDTKPIELPSAPVRRGLNRLEIHVPGVRPVSAKDSRALGLAILDLRIGRNESTSSPAAGDFGAGDASPEEERSVRRRARG